MKVVCINDGTYFNGVRGYAIGTLTIGKTYEVIEEYNNINGKGLNEYLIVDNWGFEMCMEAELFDKISIIRDEKIKQILKDENI